MTTTTLSSKGRFKNLLGGMLRKNLSVAVYLSVIFFLAFPLQTILDTMYMVERVISAGGPQMDVVSSSGTMMRATNLIAGVYTEVSIFMVVAILVFGTFVMGLVQSSYLHSKRQVDLYHSLPVTRNQLMSANMLTAFLTVMVPFFLNYIINLCTVFYRQSVLGSYAQIISPYLVLQDILGWCVSVFAILAVVMLVSTQVGSIFENFIFAGELLAAPVVIILINEMLCQEFLVGYVSKVSYRFVLASSPASLMVGVLSELGSHPIIPSYFSVIAIPVWAVLGAAIFSLALYLGRRRGSEIAESSGCRGMVGHVLTAIAIYIGGIGVGSLLYSTFNATSEALYLVSVVIGAVLVFFLVEAILNRGFAGVRKTLPLGAVSVAIVLLATLMITSGGSGGGWGYEMRRPLAEKVESITFDYRGWYDYVSELDAATKTTSQRNGDTTPYYSYGELNQVTLTSPEAIDIMRDIHLLMIDSAQKDELDYRTNGKMIQYKLKNGKTVLRQYYGYSEATAKYLRKLCETPEFQEQTNPVLRVKSNTIQSISLRDSLGFVKYELGISSDMGTLLEAMRQDARTNGTRDFTAGSDVLGYIYVNTGGDYGENRNLTENLITNFSIPVFGTSTKTIAALDSMGKGDVFGAPDLSAVTEVGFDRYGYRRRGGNILVSGVGNLLFSKGEHDYMAVCDSGMKQAIAESVRFLENRSYYSDSSDGYVFLTLYKGDEAGITVMVQPEQLPQTIKDLFPVLLNGSEDTEYLD